jgi:hypothetical protein
MVPLRESTNLSVAAPAVVVKGAKGCDPQKSSTPSNGSSLRV